MRKKKFERKKNIERKKKSFLKKIHSKKKSILEEIETSKKLKLQKTWNFEKIGTLTKIILSGKPYLLDVAWVYRILYFIHTVLYTLAITTVKQIEKDKLTSGSQLQPQASATNRWIYNVSFRVLRVSHK